MHSHTFTHAHGIDVSNAFQVNHADKSFHVVAISAADKTNWLSNLLKYIKKASPPGRTAPPFSS